MLLTVRPSVLHGAVPIPGSKSHTIRAVAIASLAEGESRIEAPLESADALSCVAAFRALGARIDLEAGLWRVKGFGPRPHSPRDTIDVGNSGTTLNVALGACALLDCGEATLDGDAQIRRRPSGPLAAALNALGAEVHALKDNDCAPFRVRGRLQGGRATMNALSSQYLTSLLLSCPLADGETDLSVPELHEVPYVEMTLDWLARQHIRVEHDENLSAFHIPGGQRYQPFERRIPADFSSATFFLCAGALNGCDVTVRGLDLTDPQGDKAVIQYLRAMGARVESGEDYVRVRPGALRGAEIDMNATPDALPMMAALACFAEGETRLVNVPQARIKETDRIAVMAKELNALGADVDELEEGLAIRHRPLKGGAARGHGDHRIVMALAIAATAAEAPVSIDTAESIAVTFPGFPNLLRSLGGQVE